MESGNGKKVQVYFDKTAMEVINDLQKMSGSQSMSEVIRDALGLYNWTLKMYREGYSIGTIKDGQAVQEVVLPFAMRTVESQSLPKS